MKPNLHYRIHKSPTFSCILSHVNSVKPSLLVSPLLVIRDSSVGIIPGYELNDREVVVRFPAVTEVQTYSGLSQPRSEGFVS
jgi:hypothetical protein